MDRTSSTSRSPEHTRPPPSLARHAHPSTPASPPWLDRYVAAAEIPADGLLFHARGDKRVAIAPSAWSKCVKATFARHGDVALCPKDARSSFITFLRGGDHDDETVKAAAIAMRHSSKIQASATYDKGGSDRRVSAAMKVAADYSAKFSSGTASSSANAY